MATSGGKWAATGRIANGAPTFSIVTCVANGAATIERTINSVLGQLTQDFEYLIIDGASTDGTPDVLARYDKLLDYWCSEPDSGIYDAWNKALRLARGEWIVFLGCDDEFHVEALLKYSDLLSRHAKGTLQYVSSRVDLMMNGKRLKTIGRAWKWPDFCEYMTVAHVGSLHHRSLFAEYGVFDSSYRICGDYEFLLRPRANLRAAYLPEVTAMAGYGGVSNRLAGAALRETYRAKRTSGGRAAWRCRIEQFIAGAKALVRAMIRNGRG